jgi:hypothetical protein
VEDRKDEGAAVDDDLLAAEAGADEADFLGGPAVEAGDDQPQSEQGGEDDPRVDGHLDHVSLS